MEDRKGILLESGTNELEIILFHIAHGTFGINVLKVKEIIKPLALTTMPHSHPNVEGIIRLRNEVIPVIDLAKAVGYPKSEDPEQDKLIITELNKMKVAFHVHAVSNIKRVSWEEIEKPTQLSQGLKEDTIGIIKMKDEETVLLLDYEKIIYDIIPGSRMSSAKLAGLEKKDRSKKNVLIAEDSAVLRELLKNTLEEAGFEKLNFTENGEDAWEFLTSEEGKNIDILITDIEMPKMDGHHLTKRVKEDTTLENMPVIIFSSLITGDIFHKGEVVGADAQISKPEIGDLVRKIDTILK
ncbi:chemotaxis protein [Evansella cellulosilytica]|uniref:Response regulator receiver modulated CheW protein n=1 Tax=Evansella cellulosilytica (strain ATCC 21833 / DSM 2522 / FERM P-1141 / JCM 9156 / N-4) TaxID=649639 RepID=E6U256_EVAC2|nr:chemotaxis protein [Evansella cellulosilytica]ADU30434.1 response regulator receiver modulated CheW protein [Evansella cellulosilytica DSM 2522]